MALAFAALIHPLVAAAQSDDFERSTDRLREEMRDAIPDPFPDSLERQAALGRLALTGSPEPRLVIVPGPDIEAARRIRARKDMLSLADGLQALYNSGRGSGPGLDFRRQLERDSKNAAKLTRRLTGFVNRGLQVPALEPVSIPEESLEIRLTTLMRLYLAVLHPMAEFIVGDVLDIHKLDSVRSDLAKMEALIETLPETPE